MAADIGKVINKLPTGWQEEADAMTETQLRNCIVESEHNLAQAISEMEANEKFQAIKRKYKEASGPLSDTKKSQKAKIAYCLFRLEQIGKL